MRRRSTGRFGVRFVAVRAAGVAKHTKSDDRGAHRLAAVMVALQDTRILCGWFLGHPATGPDPGRDLPPHAPLTAVLRELTAAGRYHAPGLFTDLDAVRSAARHAPGAFAPQALWVPGERAREVQREVDGSALGALLARATPGPAHGDSAHLVAAGHDVLGFGSDLLLTFAREPEGQRLCRRLGLPPDPPPFLPDADTADALCAALDDEDLGAPVLWVRCWRTVHAAL